MLPKLDANPIEHFGIWFNEASSCPDVIDATAMSVATVSKYGIPSNRILLLKGFDERGFKFFTNYMSRKALEIEDNSAVALNFHWAALERQVRIEGNATKLTEHESDAYFASRPRESQISAWASHQSQPLSSYEEFDRIIENLTNQYSGKVVQRPPHWGGYMLMPNMIEFWQQVNFRRHHRVQFTRQYSTEKWHGTILHP
jgi:pyridoxamine 5'-phosphate oxidase